MYILHRGRPALRGDQIAQKRKKKSQESIIPETKESLKEVNSHQCCEDKRKLFFGLSN